MIMITSLLPLLILIIILSFVVTRVFNATKSKATFLNGKVIFYLFIGYVFLLVISVVFTYTIRPVASEREIEINIVEVQQLIDTFYATVHDGGNITSVEGINKTEESVFSIDGDELKIETDPRRERYSYTWVLVEKDTSLENEIRVSHYTTPYIVNKIDFSDYLVAPKLQVEHNTLTIFPQPQVEINQVRFHKEFTITQFTNESMFSDRNYDSVSGASLLYLQVPANLNIVVDEYDDTLNVKVR